jgi:hypothetical protein
MNVSTVCKLLKSLSDKQQRESLKLELLHGENVARLDVVFNLGNLLLQLFKGNLFDEERREIEPR